MTPYAFYKRLSPLLRPLSRPYARLMAKRREMYARGALPSFLPARPCVAVGNIAWGGSGKTPLSAWLLDWSGQQGLKAALLTRGYGGRPGKVPLLVQRDTSPTQSGDEPLMLARAFPKAAVLAFPKRGESARYAQEHLDPDLFILDDGMQHLAMGRHADIVLLRPEDLQEEWNRVIPGGSWREEASALSVASVFAIKADPEEFARLVPLAEQRLAAFGKALFSFHLVPDELRPLFGPSRQKPGNASGEIAGNGTLDPASYRDQPYILVSGVSNSARTAQSAIRLMGRPPLQHFDFSDHHPYSAADVRAIVNLAAAPLPVLCTAKDAVKLESFKEEWGATPVWAIETRVEFGPSLFHEGSFPQWWEAWWRAHASGGKHCPEYSGGTA